VKKVTALLAVLFVSGLLAAACAKNTESTTTDQNSSAPTAAAMTGGGSSAGGGKALPIPLAKLPSSPTAVGNASAGAKVYSSNCASCHGAAGKNGQVGPSLAGTGLKPGQVAYMVRNPQAIDKSSSMPKLPLSSKEIADVAAYVASLK
jgi:ubiquinol-cytochrome c reductase cytochrome c subunit